MVKTSYPAAFPHDKIEQLFNNVFWVHGSIRVGPGMSMNRNMIVVQESEDLFLINPIRLCEEGEKDLNSLGKVKTVIRLGDFHGLDDCYYVDKYRAEFWCQEGQETYKSPTPTKLITSDFELPIKNSIVFQFSTAIYPEAVLFLRDHRLLITTDSVQNWTDWSYTTWLTRLPLRTLGFKMALLIGKPWLKRVTPRGGSMLGDFEKLLGLNFDNLIGAHGTPLIGGAKNQLEEVVKETFGKN